LSPALNVLIVDCEECGTHLSFSENFTFATFQIFLSYGLQVVAFLNAIENK